MAVNEGGVVRVERALDAGGDLSIHDGEHAAEEAALAYIRTRPVHDLGSDFTSTVYAACAKCQKIVTRSPEN